jgi:hypothetical protein
MAVKLELDTKNGAGGLSGFNRDSVATGCGRPVVTIAAKFTIVTTGQDAGYDLLEGFAVHLGVGWHAKFC